MWPNPRETADLVTFTEEILNGKLHFLCSAWPSMQFRLSWETRLPSVECLPSNDRYHMGKFPRKTPPEIGPWIPSTKEMIERALYLILFSSGYLLFGLLSLADML